MRCTATSEYAPTTPRMRAASRRRRRSLVGVAESAHNSCDLRAVAPTRRSRVDRPEWRSYAPRPPATPRATLPRVQPVLLTLVEIDVGDLSGRVHARIGAPRDDEPRLPAEDAGEGALERALHRAESGLQRPAAEVRPVVGDVEPDAHRASLVATLRRAQSSSSGGPTARRRGATRSARRRTPRPGRRPRARHPSPPPRSRGRLSWVIVTGASSHSQMSAADPVSAAGWASVWSASGLSGSATMRSPLSTHATSSRRTMHRLVGGEQPRVEQLTDRDEHRRRRRRSRRVRRTRRARHPRAALSVAPSAARHTAGAMPPSTVT